MALRRQQLFNRPQPSPRSGVFGAPQSTTVRDRASPGLQAGRNAVQGRLGGGARAPMPRTSQAAQQRRRQQLMSQRLSKMGNAARRPVAGGGVSRRGYNPQAPRRPAFDTTMRPSSTAGNLAARRDAFAGWKWPRGRSEVQMPTRFNNYSRSRGI